MLRKNIFEIGNLFLPPFSGSDISHRSGNITQSNVSSLKTAIKAHNLVIAADGLWRQKAAETVDIDSNLITKGYLFVAKSAKAYVPASTSEMIHSILFQVSRIT